MLRSIASIIIGYIVIKLATLVPTNMFTQMMSPSSPSNGAAGTAGGTATGTVGGTDDGTMMIFTIIVSFLAGIIGGYAAARIAGQKETWHALALGVVTMIVGIGAMLLLPNNVPFFTGLIISILFIPSTYIGGYLRGLRRTADQGTMTTNI